MADSWKGIFPYLVSPVEPGTGQIRNRILQELVDHLIVQGVHGICPLGSTGEFAYLTFEQRRDVVRGAVEAADGRVPVVPGVAAYSTHDAVRQAETFVELGADGLILILQRYFSLSLEAVVEFYRTVAEAVPCPIVIYSNPELLGSDAMLDWVEELSTIPNIRYVKEASGKTGRVLSLLKRVGDRVKIFSASAHVPLLVWQLGGVGWMAGPACLIPGQCVRLYELTCQHRWREAQALQGRMWALNELFQKYPLAACVKAGLTIQGFDVGDPCLPQKPLDAEAHNEIRRTLEVFYQEAKERTEAKCH